MVGCDHLGQLLYPVFWAVKKRNRVLRDKLATEKLRLRVERDIANTTNSRIGALACQMERPWFAGGCICRSAFESSSSSGSPPDG